MRLESFPTNFHSFSVLNILWAPHSHMQQSSSQVSTGNVKRAVLPPWTLLHRKRQAKHELVSEVDCYFFYAERD